MASVMANLADHLFRQAATRPDKCALIFGERRWTYAMLATEVSQLAGDLGRFGISAGTRIGLMVSARPEFILYQQAAFALGAIVVPLNIFYRHGEIIHAVTSCDLEWLVMDGAYRERLPDRAEVLTLKGVLLLDELGDNGWVRAASGIAGLGASLPAPVPRAPDDVCMMLNTSATTGKAKGVMLTLANIRANYDPTPGWLGLDEHTVTLCALPLYNTFGLNQGINALMVTGGTMVLMPRFDAEACLKAIHEHRCTFFPAVPTMLQKLVDHPDAPRYDLRSIKVIMTGAAPVPAALLERIDATMGRDTRVMTGYGLTEAAAIVSLERVELDAAGRVARPKSIGRVLPGIEWRIEREDGTIAAPGEVGEICIRGPGVMAGYYKQPEETAKAIRKGWLHSGDLGLIDADGYGYIVDRKKDVIIRGGQNIYPADVEEVIYHIPGVREVAVIAAPDDVLGEIVVAYVAAEPSAALDEAGVIARCKQELAIYKVPASVHFLDELPKGPTGKILRRGLRHMRAPAT
ncbi:class I adenylate-forming enzyme family protein [Falsiroseomonas sp. HW251]|uniref:class I adenylate-forming enzyme family protein n=1 Tax=Falsiroseomonas sp. HW251 TaxID=3390998 RepID=UPI003D32288E